MKSVTLQPLNREAMLALRDNDIARASALARMQLTDFYISGDISWLWVLRSKQIWVPNWYSGKFLVAFWDVFGRPERQPEFARGDTTWWIDQGKLDALKAQGALR